MKSRKLFKAIITIILLLVQIAAFGFFSYSLYLYKGVETFYRYYGILILLYLLIFISYILLRSIKKKGIVGFIFTCLFALLIVGIEGTGYYYLTKIYKSIDAYSENENEYFTSLVTYNKELKDYKSLKDNKIGLVNDSSDIEGNILPNEVITNL